MGEQSATFGVPGVADHCFFMKVRQLRHLYTTDLVPLLHARVELQIARTAVEGICQPSLVLSASLNVPKNVPACGDACLWNIGPVRVRVVQKPLVLDLAHARQRRRSATPSRCASASRTASSWPRCRGRPRPTPAACCTSSWLAGAPPCACPVAVSMCRYRTRMYKLLRFPETTVWDCFERHPCNTL